MAEGESTGFSVGGRMGSVLDDGDELGSEGEAEASLRRWDSTCARVERLMRG